MIVDVHAHGLSEDFIVEAARKFRGVFGVSRLPGRVATSTLIMDRSIRCSSILNDKSLICTRVDLASAGLPAPSIDRGADPRRRCVVRPPARCIHGAARGRR